MKRADRDAEVAKAERRSKNGAYAFLVFGENDPDMPAPDGRPWNRNYDPAPVMEGLHEALPGSPTLPLDEYIGTGVGLLYGLEDGEWNSNHLAWQLAGWNLPTTAFDKSAFKKERNGG